MSICVTAAADVDNDLKFIHNEAISADEAKKKLAKCAKSLDIMRFSLSLT